MFITLSSVKYSVEHIQKESSKEIFCHTAKLTLKNVDLYQFRKMSTN